MDTKLIKSLQTCPLFLEMTATEIASTLDAIHYRMIHFNKKDLYALEGDLCRHTDIIIDGKMTASMTSPSGKYVKVATLTKGNIMTPAYIFADNCAIPVTVESSTEVNMLRISREDFHTLLNIQEHLRWNFITLLSNLNAFLTNKLRTLSLYSVREKLANMLLMEAQRNGSRTFTLDKSRQDIADRFGIQKFSVIRQLAEFQMEGAIKIDRKNITILDATLLKKHP